ncbi:hypothetical protein [Herbidospora daliensis]|uniref:hypothetical protein n=1 Tax=Herbidospora daliensis TaxID=295585 RepID=UPI0007839842|nr:hypothetical protein [Herbidospora daliensis]
MFASIGLWALMSWCPPAYAATDVVEYSCTPKGGIPQTVQIRVELIMPAVARTGEQFSITHRATYSDSTAIQATAALPADAKMYAYVSISALPNLTSGTGVGDVVGPVTAGNTITLPTTATAVRSTPNTAGTGKVRPGDITFGTTPQDRLIDCEPQNSDALTTYDLVVTGAEASETPSATPSTTPSATPAATVTETVTDEPVDEEPVDEETDLETPEGGVATGGGGSAGPDGRVITLIGATVFGAALTGLALRRPVVASRGRR